MSTVDCSPTSMTFNNGGTITGLTTIGTAASQELIDFSASNQVSVKIDNTTELLVETGNVTVTGTCTADAWGMSSDETLKSDIEPLMNALDTLAKMRGVKFVWKSNGKRDIGFVAQQVQQVMPDLVYTHKGILRIRIASMISLIAQSVNDLHAKFNAFVAGQQVQDPSNQVQTEHTEFTEFAV